MLTSAQIVSKQKHSNINSMICCSFCQFRKNLDKNESWILSRICFRMFVARRTMTIYLSWWIAISSLRDISSQKKLKREEFNENNDKTNIFNFRNAFEHYFEQRFSVYFKLLISVLLLFANSIEIIHDVLFTNRLTDEKIELNSWTIFS